jgi:two-component system, NarL family, sensor histidine kinase EvgS
MNATTVRLRGLVVDDHPLAREILADFLTFIGCEADVAADGVEGLARFASADYDFVITDVRMPRMGGWELARSVRRTRPAAGIIALSGTLDDSDAPGPHLEWARCERFVLLGKPVAVEDLEAAIRRVTGALGALDFARTPPGRACRAS